MSSHPNPTELSLWQGLRDAALTFVQRWGKITVQRDGKMRHFYSRGAITHSDVKWIA